MGRPRLARDDLYALAVNGHGQDRAASLGNGLLHTIAGIRLDEQDDASAAPGPADFAGQGAVSPGVFDDTVNDFRRDGGQVALSKGPLFAHQAARFGPVGLFESQTHFLRDVGNALQTILDRALAADVRFVNFPIIDAVLARLPGVADDHAALEFVEIHAKLDAVFSSGWLQRRG